MNNQNNKPRVLVIGEAYTDNLGDKFIQSGVMYLIRMRWTESVIEGAPLSQIFKQAQKCQPQKNRKLKLLIKNNFAFIILNARLVAWVFQFGFGQALRNIKWRPDLVFITGGPMFDGYIFHTTAFVFWSTLFGGLFKLPVAVFGVANTQGVSKTHNRLLAFGLKFTKALTLRTDASLKRHQMSIGTEARVAPCPAFLTSEIFPYQIAKQNLAILAPSSYKQYLFNMSFENSAVLSENEYIDFYVNRCIELHEQNLELLFTCSVSSQDSEIIQKIVDKLKLSANLNVSISIPDNCEALSALLAGSLMVISGRLHVLIPAFSYGCQCEAFPYAAKLREFMDEVVNSGVDLAKLKQKLVDEFNITAAAL